MDLGLFLSCLLCVSTNRSLEKVVIHFNMIFKKKNVNRQTKNKDKCWGTKELVSMHLNVSDVITIQLTNARRPFWNPTTIFPYLGIMQLHTGCAVTASIPGICLEPLRCPVEDSQMWTVPPSVTVIKVCCGENTAACNGNPGTPGEKHRTGSPDSIFHPQTWRKTEVVVMLEWLHKETENVS